ncbi:MAG: hypothetical protein R3B90_07085 [Planctomycetaceae bacterium]
MIARPYGQQGQRLLRQLRQRSWVAGTCLAMLLGSSRGFADDSAGAAGRSRSTTGSPADAAGEEQRDPALEVHVAAEGTSSRWTKREAIDELPTSSLTPEGRRLADQVLGDVSMFRRLPTVDCEVDHSIPRFFLDYPEVAVALWRAMEISELQMTPIGPHRYSSDSGDGSVGTISVLYRTPNRRIIHCSGEFQSPVLPRPIQAIALMDLRTKEWVTTSGQPMCRFQADVYVAFPATAVETVVRVISPVSNRIADRNFQEVITFIRLMHVAMTQQPGWVEVMASRLNGIPEDRSQKLVETTAKVRQSQPEVVRTSATTASDPTPTLTPEALQLPTRRELEGTRANTERTANAVASPSALPR